MLTVILKRNVDPKEIQLTQYNLVKEMWKISGAELLTEDSWAEGLKKVRTPYVCLVEGDCILSDNFLLSNLLAINDNGRNLDKGTGGYLKLAMLASSLGVNDFDKLIYDFKIEGDEVYPNHVQHSTEFYSPQISFIPGAILRYTAIKEDLNSLPWDEPNLVKMSSIISTHLWETNRRIQANPKTVYVSSYSRLEVPVLHQVPLKAQEIFRREIL